MKRTLIVFLVLCGWIALVVSLFMIPASMDIFDLSRLSEALIRLLVLPILLFDRFTNRRYAPSDCGYICLPTLPQTLFCLFVDLVFLWILAWLIARSIKPSHNSAPHP